MRNSEPGAGRHWLTPQWDADTGIGACMTTRDGGVSSAPWASMNLGLGSGDAPAAVLANRERLAAAIGATPVFLRQVHGDRVVRVDASMAAAAPEAADASWTREPGVACTVLVSDCLPVLLAAYALLAWPFVTKSVTAALDGLPVHSAQAAATLGAT
ncbi:MAG: hypothetical protein F9K36_12595, partial [Burkholderiaceae bacterium]